MCGLRQLLQPAKLQRSWSAFAEGQKNKGTDKCSAISMAIAREPHHLHWGKWKKRRKKNKTQKAQPRKHLTLRNSQQKGKRGRREQPTYAERESKGLRVSVLGGSLHLPALLNQSPIHVSKHAAC